MQRLDGPDVPGAGGPCGAASGATGFNGPRNRWLNPHYERIGDVRSEDPADRLPRSKPVWFIEIGCAAIDKGTNQPNKFLDPK